MEKSSWVRKGSARVCFAGTASSGRWENCSLELEQTGTQRGEVEFGTLSIFGTKDRNKEHLSLSEITCVCRTGSEKTLAIHTPARSFLLMPLLLKFSGDLELEEWQADITAGRPISFFFQRTHIFFHTVFTGAVVCESSSCSKTSQLWPPFWVVDDGVMGAYDAKPL